MGLVSEGLKQELGRDPTPAEIAGPAELEEKTVEMLLALNVAEVRLDAPVGDGEDSQLIDRFYSTATQVMVQTDALIDKIIGDQVAVHNQSGGDPYVPIAHPRAVGLRHQTRRLSVRQRPVPTH